MTFIETVEKIRVMTHKYDGREHLSPLAIAKWKHDRFEPYSAWKRQFAYHLQPGKICEIGVGFGIAARAFLDACPQASYVGYDDGTDDPRIFEAFEQTFKGFHATLRKMDSGVLVELPPCDLVHVDGNHDYAHCFHDTLMALRAAPWVLVDDAHDSQVAAAAMQAAFVTNPGGLEWAYFPETVGGDILIHRPIASGYHGEKGVDVIYDFDRYGRTEEEHRMLRTTPR